MWDNADLVYMHGIPWQSVSRLLFESEEEKHLFPILHESIGMLTLRKFKEVIGLVRRVDNNLIGVNTIERDVLSDLIWLPLGQERYCITPL